MADSMPAPPPEFFGNVIRELRRHWVDAAAVREGIDPAQVDRALIIGATGGAKVRLNEAVRAAVYVGDDRIVDLDRAVELQADGGENIPIRGLVPDVPPDEPFSFFDLRLGYLSFDYQPRRQWAKQHLTTAEQFWHAARDLVMRGGLGAACENMFAAAELATMALMEVSRNAGWGHSRRSECSGERTRTRAYRRGRGDARCAARSPQRLPLRRHDLGDHAGVASRADSPCRSSASCSSERRRIRR